jgi:hypothetical protein
MPAKSSPRKSGRRRSASAASAILPASQEPLTETEFGEMIRRREPLRKKYMRYVVKRRGERPKLIHPLYIDPFLRLDHCATVHHEIAWRQALAAELLQKKNWYHYVEFHTPPYRIVAFRKLLRYHRAKLKDHDYWDILRRIYETHESPSSLWVQFGRLFASRRKQREHLMTPEERDLLRRLPDSFTVYRGYSQFDGAGMSWTLDRRVADWFAHRRSDLGQPRVITGVVRRDDVLALCAESGEAEVLVREGLVTQQVHGPAVAETMPFSVSEYARPPFDIEALCVRRNRRPGSRKRPAKAARKRPARSKVRPR